MCLHNLSIVDTTKNQEKEYSIKIHNRKNDYIERHLCR